MKDSLFFYVPIDDENYEIENQITEAEIKKTKSLRTIRWNRNLRNWRELFEC